MKALIIITAALITVSAAQAQTVTVVKTSRVEFTRRQPVAGHVLFPSDMPRKSDPSWSISPVKTAPIHVRDGSFIRSGILLSRQELTR